MAEERSNGGLASVDSMEFRWVYHQDEEGSEIYNHGNHGGDSTLRDSDDEDNTGQRLIRTGPRIDSFDVDALEVPGAQRNDYEVSILILIQFVSYNVFFSFLFFLSFFWPI